MTYELSQACHTASTHDRSSLVAVNVEIEDDDDLRSSWRVLYSLRRSVRHSLPH
jgi:hypothetical protein